MRIKKKISSLAILLVFSIIFASTVDAQRGQRRDRNQPRYEQQDRNQNRIQRRNRHQVSQGQGQGGAVGAPLDGGLLALLAGAGITYFAARKKKKKNAQE